MIRMGMLSKRSWRLGVIILSSVSLLGACSTTASQEPTQESKEVLEKTTSNDKKDDSKNTTSEETTKGKSEENKTITNAKEVTANTASPLLDKGETVTYHFPNEGIYNIHCDPHPVMKMKVIVKSDAPATGNLELDIVDYEYSKKEIVVSPGTVITWTNKDLARHNVAIEIE
jgi:plastocyanin